MLLEETIKKIVPKDSKAMEAAKARIANLTMPPWALGRILDLAGDLSGINACFPPKVERKNIVVMAGDHGVVREGVSQFPQEVTVQMVGNFVNGGAGINVFARLNRCSVTVVDMGVAGDLSALAETKKILSRKVGWGTKNMFKEPAMTPGEARKSVEIGIQVAQDLDVSTDVFGTGEMGIGNTTPSTAIASVITGVLCSEIAGCGTGINSQALQHKIAIIEESIKLHRPSKRDPLDLLSKVGGFEIGGLAGLILGAASLRKPVVIDGFISTAAALLAAELCPNAIDYMIAAHQSKEAGHKIMLNHLGLKPLLDLDLRLGEGTGGALAMNLIDAAFCIVTEMATFQDAGVSRDL